MIIRSVAIQTTGFMLPELRRELPEANAVNNYCNLLRVSKAYG